MKEIHTSAFNGYNLVTRRADFLYVSRVIRVQSGASVMLADDGPFDEKKL